MDVKVKHRANGQDSIDIVWIPSEVLHETADKWQAYVRQHKRLAGSQGQLFHWRSRQPITDTDVEAFRETGVEQGLLFGTAGNIHGNSCQRTEPSGSVCLEL